MNRKFFIFNCFIFFLFFYSQENEIKPPIEEIIIEENTEYTDGWLETDSLLDLEYTTDYEVYPRNFDENFRNKYKSREFDYEMIQPRESLIDRFKRRLSSILESIFGKIEPNKSLTLTKFLYYFLIFIGAGIIIYFLVQFLINKEGTFFWNKINQKNNIVDIDLHENIHEINFFRIITEYELLKNYRMAVRYHYLWILKKLSDQETITWNPQKTNKDYIKEYPTNNNKYKFLELSSIFDFVWYGEFEINDNQYNKIKNKFVDFS